MSSLSEQKKGEDNMAAADCVKGLIMGGLIGAIFGILYAPKSGKETREEIIISMEELLNKAKEQYEEACKKIEKLADHEKELYIENKERLKKTIEAGVEAFKKEKTAASPV
jgi:gas vesicle protein